MYGKKLYYLTAFVLVLVVGGSALGVDPLQQDPGPDGIVSVEAENFDENVANDPHTWDLITEAASGFSPPGGFSGGAAMQSTPTTPATGAGYNDPADFLANSPRLDYNITFTHTGTHYVWVLAWGLDGNSDSLHSGLDGEHVETADRIGGINNNYRWTNDAYQDAEPISFDVTTTGLHTLNIWMREDGSVVDKIVLTTNPDYTPVGTGPAESRRGPIFKAYSPSPEDAALVEATWATLSWTAGDFAVSHDVYLGENLDDVNDATYDSPAFHGNQVSTMFIIGFAGFPYPDGLVPGSTYYWRIDEVDDANAASPWKGDLWSFSVPPRTGYNPVPADGAKFVETAGPTLSWTAGFNAKLHTVYFGSTLEEVDAATGGTPQADTTFVVPGPLDPETTYYWRVDEFDPPATHKGPVWSFTTARLGGGIKGEYFNNENLTGAPVLTRIDDLINFYWNPGPDPPPGINEDYFSIRWTGELEAPFSEPFTFITGADDGARVYLDGQRIINDWGSGHDYTEVRSEPIDLVAGEYYSFVMEGFELGGEAEWRLFWESPSMPRQVVPQAALSLLVHAYAAEPANGTQGVNLASDLKWKPAEFAVSHEVYLGTDADAVANATKASPEYQGSKALGEESLDPGQLDFDTTYYWRIDEVNAANPDSPWTGSVWSFWTGDFLVVDDFEAYDDVDPAPGEPGQNRIFDKWIDGFGTTTNGALVGNDLPPYAETTIVNNGLQSMIYRYDNDLKTSEATLTLVYPRDWTAEGVTKLSLWYRGDSANALERMFVAVNGTAVVYHNDPAVTQTAEWTEWVIELQEFANQGVALTNVNTITIGFGTKNAPAAGGTGTMYFDDIRLYRP